MQRSSRPIGGQNPCRACCFASVFLKQTVELNHLFQRDRGKTASTARGMFELNRLFQKAWGNTASAARILSPNPRRRHLPCLLSQSFSMVIGQRQASEMAKSSLVAWIHNMWQPDRSMICLKRQVSCLLKLIKNYLFVSTVTFVPSQTLH